MCQPYRPLTEAPLEKEADFLNELSMDLKLQLKGIQPLKPIDMDRLQVLDRCVLRILNHDRREIRIRH